MGQSHSTELETNTPASSEEEAFQRRRSARLALNNPSAVEEAMDETLDLSIASKNSRSLVKFANSFFRENWKRIRRIFTIKRPERKLKAQNSSRFFNHFDRIINWHQRRQNDCYEMNHLGNSKVEPDEKGNIASKTDTLKDEEVDRAKTDILNLNRSQFNVSSSMPVKKYLAYPFLVDDNTINWIKSQHVMFILRGLPGSGKSTLAKTIKSVYAKDANGDFITCSADDFFIANGSYLFERTRLKDAHEYCQNRMKEATISGIRTIVIDNCNLRYWEMKPYFQTANSKGYITVVVEPNTPWRWNADVLAEKNIHGCQPQQLRYQLNLYQPVVPSYFGWFLSSYDGKILQDISKDLLKLCLDKCDNFNSDFKDFTLLTDLNLQIGYYKNQSLRSQILPKLHCTAKYCKRYNGKLSSDLLNYASSMTVNSSLGHLKSLAVIGFVITKSTFGARIKLTDSQLELYDQPDNERVSNDANLCIDKVNSSFEFIGAEENENLEKIDRMEKTTDFCPVSEKGRSAHITLGTATGVCPAQTGLDQLEAIRFEKNASLEKLYYNIFTYQIPETEFILRRYRNDLWVLYKSGQSLVFDAMFTGHYV